MYARGRKEDDERGREGGEEWRDKKKKERERECDNTTKWDQEGILSRSCVPVTPPGNICFISVTTATLFLFFSFLNRTVKTKYCRVIIGNVTMVNY